MNRISVLGILILVVLSSGFAFAGTSGPAPIPPPPNFQISTNVITLCKGMLNSVPISIKTPKGAAVMESVQLSLSNSRYAYTVGNGTVSAVNVTPNVTKVVPLMVFVSLNATPLISTGIGIDYQYLTLYTDTEVRNISFGTKVCPTPLSVSVSPKILTAGKIQNVTFNFTNTGNTPLNYLSIHASLPSVDGTFLGLQPIQINSIPSGNSTSIEQEVFVFSDADQSFPINLSVSFYNGTSLEQRNINPIMLSSGVINITPSSTTLSPSIPTAGSIFSISFVLTNIGTTKASAVTATALSPKGFLAYGSNSTFVGDIAVDTQTPVTLTLISQGSLAPGNYTIPVRISYLNNLRQNLSTTIYVPVEITKTLSANSLSGRQGRRGSSSMLTLLALIIVVIAVSVLYFMERGKHKKLREEHKRLKNMHNRG